MRGELERGPVVVALAGFGWSRAVRRGGDALVYSLEVRRGEERGWATVTPPQAESSAALTAQLRFAHPGIAPLALVHVEPDCAFLVEQIPDGPSADELAPSFELARAVGRALLRAVAPVHSAGKAMGGLRPERVVVPVPADPDTAIVAPRAEPFTRSARPSSVGIAPMYAEPYLAREALMGLPPTPATDVFAIAATVVRLASGRHPFGQGHREVFMAIGRGAAPRVEIPGLGAGPREVLTRALSASASDRASSAELALAL